MMLMILDNFSQALLILLAKSLMTLSKLAMSNRLDILRFLKDKVISLMKTTSSLLFLIIEHLVELMLSSIMGMVMVRGVWSNIRCYLGCIK